MPSIPFEPEGAALLTFDDHQPRQLYVDRIPCPFRFVTGLTASDPVLMGALTDQSGMLGLLGWIKTCFPLATS